MDLDNYPPPDLSWSNIKHYLGTRISTLKPPKLTEAEKKHMNPIPALRLLNKKQWLFVGVALAGWTWDAFDFFSVGVVATQIAEDLNVTVKDVTWGITLVLMLRAVGAVLFGVASDRYGRKWPLSSTTFSLSSWNSEPVSCRPTSSSWESELCLVSLWVVSTVTLLPLLLKTALLKPEVLFLVSSRRVTV